ncbi:uncharacterized protein BDR25DRAFT_359364 [Lindgomyces ingoldianus]|uniref:Uncharacterized protein n=1 Tax=Lindgomyces ingoldianus TaxID=673940 RepID=A0ACB6QJZ8_9PLEO|nr:uncharacterized protein BDR25DRAFT_359364 [Lindgomyces ingoldianus]KAF2466840.1 hypothetical protein BDR25DRAFT_359364 [Lindgomyces ingoldianus]
MRPFGQEDVCDREIYQKKLGIPTNAELPQLLITDSSTVILEHRGFWFMAGCGSISGPNPSRRIRGLSLMGRLSIMGIFPGPLALLHPGSGPGAPGMFSAPVPTRGKPVTFLQIAWVPQSKESSSWCGRENGRERKPNRWSEYSVVRCKGGGVGGGVKTGEPSLGRHHHEAVLARSDLQNFPSLSLSQGQECNFGRIERILASCWLALTGQDISRCLLVRPLVWETARSKTHRRERHMTTDFSNLALRRQRESPSSLQRRTSEHCCWLPVTQGTLLSCFDLDTGSEKALIYPQEMILLNQPFEDAALRSVIPHQPVWFRPVKSPLAHHVSSQKRQANNEMGDSLDYGRTGKPVSNKPGTYALRPQVFVSHTILICLKTQEVRARERGRVAVNCLGGAVSIVTLCLFLSLATAVSRHIGLENLVAWRRHSEAFTDCVASATVNHLWPRFPPCRAVTRCCNFQINKLVQASERLMRHGASDESMSRLLLLCPSPLSIPEFENIDFDEFCLTVWIDPEHLTNQGNTGDEERCHAVDATWIPQMIPASVSACVICPISRPQKRLRIEHRESPRGSRYAQLMLRQVILQLVTPPRSRGDELSKCTWYRLPQLARSLRRDLYEEAGEGCSALQAVTCIICKFLCIWALSQLRKESFEAQLLVLEAYIVTVLDIWEHRQGTTPREKDGLTRDTECQMATGLYDNQWWNFFLVAQEESRDLLGRTRTGAMRAEQPPATVPGESLSLLPYGAGEAWQSRRRRQRSLTSSTSLGWGSEPGTGGSEPGTQLGIWRYYVPKLGVYKESLRLS